MIPLLVFGHDTPNSLHTKRKSEKFMLSNSFFKFIFIVRSIIKNYSLELNPFIFIHLAVSLLFQNKYSFVNFSKSSLDLL